MWRSRLPVDKEVDDCEGETGLSGRRHTPMFSQKSA
eukprot:CAMPEP_0173102492 /NCGR_PEP_ID=MMETSP1102-20130122/37617_1 /TAXON_ID=49646 /ORGANISM="Geminigera sp., Strain Caron Lab Isolate" /LENGTH=35 /DNA_ID= /DNA_START= /DNA_END= /DNA_ORIENTATION=